MTYYSLKKIATSTVVVVAVPLLFCLSILLESLDKYNWKKIAASYGVAILGLTLLAFSALWVSASIEIASAEAKQEAFLKPKPLELTLLEESSWTWKEVVSQGLGTTTFERVVVRIGQKDLVPGPGSWMVKINGGEGDYHLIVTGNPSFPAPGIATFLDETRVILVDGLFPKKEEVPVPTISEAMKAKLTGIWTSITTPAKVAIRNRPIVGTVEVTAVIDSKVGPQGQGAGELFDETKFHKTSAKIDWEAEFTASSRVEARVVWGGEERIAYIRFPGLMYPSGDCEVFESLQGDKNLFIFYRGPHGV